MLENGRETAHAVNRTRSFANFFGYRPSYATAPEVARDAKKEQKKNRREAAVDRAQGTRVEGERKWVF